MMTLEQGLITWIHLISSAVWVGGSLFIAIVLAPLLKTMTVSIEERLQIMILVGRRFNKIAIPALAVLIVTGIYNSHQILARPDFLVSTNYGILLLIKMILVAALLASFAIHVRIIRKDVEQKIVEKRLDESEVARLRKKIIIVGEVTVVLSVAVLFFAALLDAGL